jgi:4-hydroxybenzoate polyprenyltransferase
MSADGLARRFANLVRIEHTVFALPYAYVGAILSVNGWPGLAVLVWITVAMVGARSFAMAVNRLVDAAIDARNPRTAGRELPAGRLKRSQVILFAVVVARGLRRGRLAARLDHALARAARRDPMVIYPYLKRFTPLCHLWLGIVDGLAPVGGWVAVTGHFSTRRGCSARPSPAGSAGSTSSTRRWTSTSTAQQGLHSMPADYGIARALYDLARAARAERRGAGGRRLLARHLGPVYAIGVIAVAALLAYEQQLVSPTDLSRVDMAFLSVNGVIALLYLGTVSLDVVLS